MFRLLFLGFFLVAQPLFAASFANAQFVMDIPDKEFREKVGIIVLNDLAVGETGIIERNFCQYGHDLFVPKSEVLFDKKFEYSANIQAKREPNNTVSIVMMANKNEKAEWNAFLRNLAIGTVEKCQITDINSDTYFKIKSINGFNQLSDLVEHKLQ